MIATKSATLRLTLMGLLLGLFQPAWADRYALLVGINEYAIKSASLKGCETDAKGMKEVLVKKFGFADDAQHLQMLLSREATKANIMAGLKWLQTSAKPNDSVVFFFSGHGGQRYAEKDKSESDGLDETLMPYDFKFLDFAFDILDDELDAWLRGMKTDNVAIILDCCHAGTGAKGLTGYSKPRTVTALPGYQINPKQLPARPSAGQRDPNVLGGPVKGALLAACQAESTALDTGMITPDGQAVYYGLFTHTLLGVVRSAAPSMSWSQLAAEVSRRVQARRAEQIPQLEGTASRLSGAIFFGSVNAATPPTPPPGVTTPPPTPTPTPQPAPPLASSPTHAVVKNRLPNRQVTLDWGANQSATVGSIYRVYAKTAPQLSGKGVGYIQIARVTASGSQATVLTEQPAGAIDAGCKAIEVAHNFGLDKLRVVVDAPGFSQDNRLELIAALSQANYLELISGQASGVPDRHVEMTKSGEVFSFTVKTMSGEVEASGERLTLREASARVRAALENAYVVKRLANLENPTPSFNVRLTLDKGDQATYTLGDPIAMKLKATQDCYITVVEIGTSGRAQILFPNRFRRENFIKANEEVALPNPARPGFRLMIDPRGPTGYQVYKVIATIKPLRISEFDLAGVEQEFKPLAQLGRFVSELNQTLSLQLTPKDTLILRDDTGAAAVEQAAQSQQAVALAGWATDMVVFKVEAKAATARALRSFAVGRRTVSLGTVQARNPKEAQLVTDTLEFWLRRSPQLRLVAQGAEVTLTGQVAVGRPGRVTVSVTSSKPAQHEEATGAEADVAFLVRQLANRIHYRLTAAWLPELKAQEQLSAKDTLILAESDPVSQVTLQPTTSTAPATSKIAISLTVDRPNATYFVGEEVTIRFKTDRDCYVTVYNIDPVGKSIWLYPNRLARGSPVRANKEYLLPPAGAGWSIEVDRHGALGLETIVLVATLQPSDLPGSSEIGEAPTEVAASSLDAFARSLRVRIKDQLDQGVSSARLQFYTAKKVAE